MTIKVTIEVPDTKIGTLLARLNGYKALCEHVTERFDPSWNDPRKAKSNGKMHNRADSLLTMTGKTPNKNSKLAKALEIFEKLEKRKGIGTINVAAFRVELEKKEEPKTLSQRCVTEKVLAYL